MSASCHIAILEQSRVILSFVFAGQVRRERCIVININSDTTNLAIRYSFRVRARVNKELKLKRRRRLRKRNVT